MAADPPFDLNLRIRQRRLRFLGHVLRMEPDRLVRQTLLALTQGGTRFPEGSLFMDIADKTIEEDILCLAKDKFIWNVMVGDLC